MLKSGGGEIERGLHYGKQTYDSDQSQWPLYQPVSKLEAFPQTSGSLSFCLCKGDDITRMHQTNFGFS